MGNLEGNLICIFVGKYLCFPCSTVGSEEIAETDSRSRQSYGCFRGEMGSNYKRDILGMSSSSVQIWEPYVD